MQHKILLDFSEVQEPFHALGIKSDKLVLGRVFSSKGLGIKTEDLKTLDENYKEVVKLEEIVGYNVVLTEDIYKLNEWLDKHIENKPMPQIYKEFPNKYLIKQEGGKFFLDNGTVKIEMNYYDYCGEHNVDDEKNIHVVLHPVTFRKVAMLGRMLCYQNLNIERIEKACDANLSEAYKAVREDLNNENSTPSKLFRGLASVLGIDESSIEKALKEFEDKHMKKEEN